MSKKVILSQLQKSVTFATALAISRLKAAKHASLSGSSCKTGVLQLALLLILAVSILALLPSCRERKPKTAVELRFGFTSEPATFDPLIRANTADGRSILFNVFEGLFKPDTEGGMQPAIAESWSIEQDGLIYNIYLREGVLFHDGTPLIAEDVKFSLETAREAGFMRLDAINKIDIISDNIIRITLKEPDMYFFPYLTTAIVMVNNPNRENNIIGTGPFFVESYRPQIDLVLRRNEHYWREGIPHLERVRIVFFANSDAQLIALRGGSIDGARITGSMSAQLNKRYFDINHAYSAAVQLLALNNAVHPFDNILVRRALNYGINIQEIIDTAFFGLGTPSRSPVIPGLRAYYYNPSNFYYNPDTARSLLLEAGFEEGALSFEITVPSNFTMHVDTAQVIVSQLERLGINASIRQVDWPTWLSDTFRGRNFQATIISVDSPVVSARSFLARYETGADGNFINFSNSDFDSVFASLLAEKDRERRIKLIKDAQRIMSENAASVFIQDIQYFTALRGGAFGGVTVYPLYVDDFSAIYGIERN